MSSAESSGAAVRLAASNVGGIDETRVELRPGVNLLTGPNASNRTSLLQALMAALGSDRASLKGDADEGRVELEIGEATYTRTIARRDGELVFGGEPYPGDPELADLFAFLLESNDARRAVARGEDLREIIMRPVDTAAIQAEIAELEARLRDVESALDERDRLLDERDSLEADRGELVEQIDETAAALDDKRAEIDAADAELEATREREAELESKLAALRERRSTLEDVRFRLETERETVDGIEAELAGIEDELDAGDGSAAEDIEQLDERIDDLRDRRRGLDSKLNQLQTLVQFNEEMLDGTPEGGADVLESSAGSADDVPGRLLPEGDTFVCWTCGEETTRADVERTLERLRDRRSAIVRERSELDAELDEATERKAELAERRQRRSSLERRRDDLEGELESAEDEIESLERRRARLVEAIDGIEEEIESLREEEYDEVVDLHTAANALELELEGLESELEGTRERLRETAERLDEMESLEAERSELRTQLEERRTRIERLEDEAIAAFNGHMEAVLDVLGYENIARIWIERTERAVQDGRRTERRAFFELHVVRETAAGAAYEDTVEHLSESEREVTGLVFALAGYLAHEVHEQLPFLLLDSIEAIDSDRIASLVEYVGEHAPYLVVALLPEDAEYLDDGHRRITDI